MANGENLTVEQRLLALQLLDAQRERIEGRKKARNLAWTKQITSAQVVQHERIQAAVPRSLAQMREHLLEIQASDTEIEDWKKDRKAEIQKLDKQIAAILLAIHEVLHLGKNAQTDLPFDGVGETLQMTPATLEVMTTATEQVIEDEDYAGEATEEQTKELRDRLAELAKSAHLPPTDEDLATASEEPEAPEGEVVDTTAVPEDDVSDADLLESIGFGDTENG